MRAGELVEHALKRLAVAVVEGANGFKPSVLRGAMIVGVGEPAFVEVVVSQVQDLARTQTAYDLRGEILAAA